MALRLALPFWSSFYAGTGILVLDAICLVVASPIDRAAAHAKTRGIRCIEAAHSVRAHQPELP